MIKTIQTKQQVEGRTVCGYAAIFNNIDTDQDMIKPGAFLRSIREQGPEGLNRIVFLNQHNKLQVLGKPLILREDNYGLYHETPVTETTFGNDALVNIKAGVLDGFSIGFNPIQTREQSKFTEIREVKLMEYSIVTWPANEEARLTDVKGQLVDAVEYGDADEVAYFIQKLRSSFPETLTDDQKFARELKLLAEDRFPGGDFASELTRIFNTLK